MRQRGKRRRPSKTLTAEASAKVRRADERRAIDDAFRPMKDDVEYRREALTIAKEFARSDAKMGSIEAYKLHH